MGNSDFKTYKGTTMPESIIELITGGEEPQQNQGMMRVSKQEVAQYHVFIDEEIGEPKKYRDLINTLYSASPHDVFNIFINTPGGSLSSTMAIIEAIKSSDATVVGIINGECFSGGSFLALSCDHIVVTPAAHMMVHTASYGTGGNTGMIQKHVDFSTKHIHKVLDEVYEGFLTDQELKDIKIGVELWFDSVQIKKRLENRNKYFAEKQVKKPKKQKVESIQE